MVPIVTKSTISVRYINAVVHIIWGGEIVRVILNRMNVR